MTFTVPNLDAASFPYQAAPDQTDIEIMAAGYISTGVVSGCGVTAQGTPDNTVAVASGSIKVAGVVVPVTSGDLTITAAHDSLPRRDIAVANDAGTKSYVAGTAAEVPVKPAIPADSVVLAEIYVPAGDNVVNTAQITDKRILLYQPDPTTVNAIWIPPAAFLTGGGGTATALGSVPNAIQQFNWSAAGSSNDVMTHIVMPAQYLGGNVRFTMRFSQSDTNAGNIRFRINWSVVEVGDVVTETGTNIDYTQAASGVSSGLTKGTAQTITPTGLAAGDLLRIGINRLGADGADTATGNTQFHGLYVEFDV